MNLMKEPVLTIGIARQKVNGKWGRLGSDRRDH
jgi:hypothetical protein